MQEYFFDTSALVKFFVIEKGTELVEKIILDSNSKIYITSLSHLEFKSALFRKFRNTEINETNLKIALEGYTESLFLFNLIEINNYIINHAQTLIEAYGQDFGLRTLDAIQLSAFDLIENNDIFLVNADKHFCAIANSMNFKTINPVET